jgi:hypothetical protein
MMGQPKKPRTMAVFRGVAAVIGLLAGLAPKLVHAQVSIDTGKTPADIFALDCATCHKGARGLAHGKSSAELASFLAEHYTSSKDQAAALAAYVMGAGGGDAAPAGTARGPKTQPDHPAAAAAEPQKPSPPGKPTGKPTGKPEEAPSATAKLQPDEDKKPPASGPGRQPPATAAKNRRNGPEPVPPAQPPAAAVSEPVAPSIPAQESNPVEAPTQSAAAPAGPEPSDAAPVPRDDIPD